MSEALAARLRHARGSLSLSEAASRAGIPETRIRLYEEGVRQPYGKTLRRLAEAYGTPVVELGAPARTPREAPPPRQRRRRRRVAPTDTGSGLQVIEIPVDIREGEPIRVRLELILRPRSSAPAAPAPALAPPVQAAVDERSGPPLAQTIRREPALTAFRQAYDAFLKERR